MTREDVWKLVTGLVVNQHVLVSNDSHRGSYPIESVDSICRDGADTPIKP